MKKSDTADLLRIINAFDHRHVGEVDVEAWYLILSGYEVDDCAEAVRAHYTETTDWLMPAHVVSRVTAMIRSRDGQRRIAELEAADEAETRALEAQPVEPYDREALKARLKAASVLKRPPRVDPRPDPTRLAEAKAELDALRTPKEAS